MTRAQKRRLAELQPQILALHRDGVDRATIAQQLSISRCAVQHTVRTHELAQATPRPGKPYPKRPPPDLLECVRLAMEAKGWTPAHLASRIGSTHCDVARRLRRSDPVSDNLSEMLAALDLVVVPRENLRQGS